MLSTQCIQMMADGAAHASVLDGGDVVYAHDTFGMQPLVVEKSGGVTSDGHDYAVAVVRKVRAALVSRRSVFRGCALSSCFLWTCPARVLQELCEASAAASLASLESANSCHGGFRTMVRGSVNGSIRSVCA